MGCRAAERAEHRVEVKQFQGQVEEQGAVSWCWTGGMRGTSALWDARWRSIRPNGERMESQVEDLSRGRVGAEKAFQGVPGSTGLKGSYVKASWRD